MTGEEMAALLADVTIAVDVALFEASQERIAAVFSYARNDPHAVTAAFETREGTTTWSFARELLREGILEPTGEGSVRISPGPGDSINLDLRTVDGAARVICDRVQLQWFIDQIYATVPEGSESDHMPIDDWLTRLSL